MSWGPLKNALSDQQQQRDPEGRWAVPGTTRGQCVPLKVLYFFPLLPPSLPLSLHTPQVRSHGAVLVVHTVGGGCWLLFAERCQGLASAEVPGTPV